MNGVFPQTEMACALVAATASLSSSYSNVKIYTGTDNDDKAAPAVICWAESATEDFPFSGIWHVKTNIIVKEMAITSSIQAVDPLIGDIQAAFLTSNIEQTLTSKLSASYFVYQVVFDSNDSTTDGDAWVHTMGLDIVCTTR